MGKRSTRNKFLFCVLINDKTQNMQKKVELCFFSQIEPKANKAPKSFLPKPLIPYHPLIFSNTLVLEQE